MSKLFPLALQALAVILFLVIVFTGCAQPRLPTSPRAQACEREYSGCQQEWTMMCTMPEPGSAFVPACPNSLDYMEHCEAQRRQCESQ